MQGAVMRGTLGLAALLILLSVNAVQAGWCGSASRDSAIIECGYATAADCQQSVGKGGVCFVDPDVALKSHATSAKQVSHNKS